MEYNILIGISMVIASTAMITRKIAKITLCGCTCEQKIDKSPRDTSSSDEMKQIINSITQEILTSKSKPSGVQPIALWAK